MLTEIWFKTKDKAIRLPIVPSEFERVIDANYETNNVIGLGDVATFGGNGLAQISFSSFFPNHEYSFNAYSNVPKPYDIAHIFKEWKACCINVHCYCKCTCFFYKFISRS